MPPAIARASHASVMTSIILRQSGVAREPWPAPRIRQAAASSLPAFLKKGRPIRGKTRIRAEPVRQDSNRQYSGNRCPLRASFLFICARAPASFRSAGHSHLPQRQRVRRVGRILPLLDRARLSNPFRKFRPTTNFFLDKTLGRCSLSHKGTRGRVIVPTAAP
jgi:hypothetical protein